MAILEFWNEIEIYGHIWLKMNIVLYVFDYLAKILSKTMIMRSSNTVFYTFTSFGNNLFIQTYYQL